MFRIFMFLYCLYIGSSFVTLCLASKNYGLCDINEAISDLNGYIIQSAGDNCKQTVLAPQGWRIRLTMYDLFLRHYLWIYDGRRIHHPDPGTANLDYPPGHRNPRGTEMYSTSNALVIYTERITSDDSRFNFSFAMFPQSTRRCGCPPVYLGITLCTLSTGFSTGDTLRRLCRISCDKGHGLFTTHHTVSVKQHARWMCSLDETKDETQAKWDGELDGGGSFYPKIPDVNLITCSNLNPPTRVKSIYSMNYISSCENINLEYIEGKVVEHIVNAMMMNSSYEGQCFRNISANMNCTVNRVNTTCAYSSSQNKSLIKLVIKDNIKESVNITITEQIYDKLIKLYTNILPKSLHTFFSQDLHVNNESATNYQAVRVALKICPDNYALSTVGDSAPLTCILCAKHFEKRSVSNYEFCAKCKDGQRRKLNEDKCVAGERNYSNRSFSWCPHTCALGKFFNNNSGLCEWCPYGAYQNSTSDINPVCHKCPNGTSTVFVGAIGISDCISLCEPGYYIYNGSCLECPIRYYMPKRNHRFHKCYQCPNGKTTIQRATYHNSSCVDICTLGQYFNISRGICLPCPHDTYQDETKINNTQSCKSCPANTVTGKFGSQSLNACLGPCNAGQFVDISIGGCSPCPLNTYTDHEEHVNYTCKTCGNHKITKNVGTTNSSGCIYTCGKGELFNMSNKTCQKCQIGYYQNEEGKDFCKPCQGKSFTVKVGSSQCIQPCIYGEFLNKSAEKCQKCQQGYFQNSTEHQMTSCLSCPLNQYNNQIGQHNCTQCPEEKITVITGAQTSSDCISTCEPGTFLNRTRKSCQECLKGFYQSQKQYKLDHCIKCPYANQTTTGAGATNLEQCVGYCASLPCLNGGECINVDYGFNCTCPKHLEGKRCELITDEKDADTIEVAVRLLNLAWNKELVNSESIAFKQLAVDIENSIREGLKDEPTFRKLKVREFSQGSVISVMEIDYVSGPNFSTPIDTLQSIISFGKLGNFTVDNSSLQILNYTCSQPLGMENKRIPDEAITSGNEENHHPPSNARLNFNGPGWTPRILYLEKAYLQVDFQQEVLLTGIATQGSKVDNENCWLNGYWMNYSSDGRNWHTYKGDKIVKKVFGGNTDVDTVVRNNMKYPVSTRYVRIFEYTFTPVYTLSYRIEFYGCPIPKTVELPTKLPPTRVTTLVTTLVTTPVTTTNISKTTENTKGKDDDEGTNVGLIVGIVIAVIVVVILVALTAWCLRGKKRGFHNVSVKNTMPMTENPRS